jgi:tRNA/rRNA methyltransferase
MSAAEPPPPVFVLVEPQMGENIGAAARAMWNFGLDRMRLVAPRDGWPNSRAAATASGAGRVLDGAGVFASTAAALADLTHVFATTARPREMTKPVLTPEQAMREARALAAAGERVGVLFGPERAGLVNDDVALADAIISVPVNPDFASLNLGQCVLLTAYEWRREAVPAAPETLEMPRTRRASQVEVERLWAHWDARLSEAGFFFPDHKAEVMRLNLRNLLARMAATTADVQTLHGVLRQLVRQAGHGGFAAEPGGGRADEA